MMDSVINFKPSEKILVVEENSNLKSIFPETLTNNCLFINFSSLSDLKDKYDTIVSINKSSNQKHDSSILTTHLKHLKPGGRTFIYEPVQNSDRQEELKKTLLISGFVNISLTPTKDFSAKYDGIDISQVFQASNGNEIILAYSEKPHYEVGSFKTLSLSQAKSDSKDVASVWKIDDDEDDDIINADDLLDEDDLKRPDPSSLKVCGTTGKRKACKGCVCGLAEELEEEANKKKNTSNAKSSCGSCYLGDAFRCASCPYLGMPAFKPGEKIELSDQFLSPDI